MKRLKFHFKSVLVGAICIIRAIWLNLYWSIEKSPIKRINKAIFITEETHQMMSDLYGEIVLNGYNAHPKIPVVIDEYNELIYSLKMAKSDFEEGLL